jgi:hypothetical protein
MKSDKIAMSFRVSDSEFVCHKSWYIPHFVYRLVISKIQVINVGKIEIKELGGSNG